MVVILGAGLAGLSAAYHLGDRDVLVVERESEPGGLCRSIRRNGFTYDFTGHLLHLRDEGIRSLVHELLPKGYAKLHRSAWIHSYGSLTPYPFQANTAGLPIDVRLECLLGFVEAMAGGQQQELPVPAPVPIDPSLPFLASCPAPSADEPTFLDWIMRTFGAGFAKHFFVPYNHKMWRRDLSEVTGDWVSWSIPRPELADVLRGALTDSGKTFGYNPDFLYPSAGGIDHLPRSLANKLSPGTVQLNCSVEELNAKKGLVRFSNGETQQSELILSSLPLPKLAALTSDLPDDLAAAAASLSHVSIRAVNLGIAGAPPHPDAQWVYCPDPSLNFHRIGLPCALTPAMSPEGHHSIVAEISYRPEDDCGADVSLEQTLDGLQSTGFLSDASKVVDSFVVDIPEAYVVFDRERRKVLPALYRWYLDRGVVTMGRYGTWDYLAMEDSLVHGRQVATWIDGRTS
ncbi:MAG: protoporphyrinogen oxidase [Pseudohongiellaceae bacterium]|jgi:protoporphyrinogen oxidase